MKIAWFTPFTKMSAIGQFSQRVSLELLNQGHELTIFTSCSENLLETKALIQKIDLEKTIAELVHFDHVIYNYGDYNLFHRDIVAVSFHRPGVVIQHDVSLFNLVYGSVNSPAFIDSRNLDWLNYQQFFKFAHENNFLPLLNFSATQVICHSKYAFDRTVQNCASIANQLFLPNFYDLKMNQIKTNHSEKKSWPNWKEKKYFLSFGNVNANRCIEHIIESLYLVDKTVLNDTQYILAGSLGATAYVDFLKEKVQLYNLQDRVIFLGAPSDEELFELIENALFCINLRNPAIEGASASIILQMFCEKATIVTDIGVYAELPNNSVFKISVGREVEELQRLLPKLLTDRELVKCTGQIAKNLIQTKFSASLYAQRIAEILKTPEKFPILKTDYALAAKRIQTKNLDSLNPEAYRLASKLAIQHTKNPPEALVLNIRNCLFAYLCWLPRAPVSRSLWSIRCDLGRNIRQIIRSRLDKNQPAYEENRLQLSNNFKGLSSFERSSLRLIASLFRRLQKLKGSH